MAQTRDRIAVVVVHGMGNQFPMDTLNGFVDAVKPEAAVLFSSPNRITDERETRRLSFNSAPYDFYEYYWAHYVEDPGFTAVVKWAFSLIFLKTPSARLQPHIKFVRFFIIFLLLGIAGIAFLLWYFFKDNISGILSFTLFGTSVFVVVKLLWSMVSSTVVGAINDSVGDVIKYTVPSPENIATREKIRKNGIELLKNLHEAKADNGNLKYSKIIVVAHSLGTVVAYDILTSLFAQYHRKFAPVIPVKDEVPARHGQQIPSVTQNALEALKQNSVQPDHTDGKYQQFQSDLFDEFRSLSNQWRVSNFITMGSPLTHAAMVLTPSQQSFEKKKSQREFPTCPPQIDAEDEHFAFPVSFSKSYDKKVRVKCLHHAAHFAATQWTNIYFKNDWIGGSLANEFGAGIKDIQVIAGSKWTASIPLASHTKYWDVKHQAALTQLKEVFIKIHPFINE